MLPIGPLMIEHRLIEKMIELMKHELLQGEEQQKINPRFIETATDFIRAYADRCHHGKEEDILFRALEKKALSNGEKRILEELVEDHKQGRGLTRRLEEANERYAGGDPEALPVIVECLKTLAAFYPRHIEKEDRHFFIPIMTYFTKEEKEAMLAEEYEFDRKLIHEKYRNVVTQWQ
jgi:hemerythrin-like domain-containing protein